MLADSRSSIGWEGFLNRAALTRDRSQAAASLQGKSVLITGAGGSIGSALALAVAECAPRRLVLLEASEGNLYHLESALDSLPVQTEVAFLLGSVADTALLEEISGMHRPHIVYHAAAFKHVPLMERNPFAAIHNNAIATDRLLGAATRHGAEQLILLSTDKAVDPVSIMGASKRIAELILLAAHSESLQTKIVRLGNVLGSEGSIVPLFLQQIEARVPLTVTHPDIRRYFLTLADAVTLLLHAASSSTRPGILVPNLGVPLKVSALARYLMASTPGDASIVFTQPRPGDKMCEALLSARECYRAPEDDSLLQSVESEGLAPALLYPSLLELQRACEERSLERLLAAVLRLVPEYRASALLEARRQSCAETA